MFLKKNLSSGIFTVAIVLLSLWISGGSAVRSNLVGKYLYDTDPQDKAVHDLLLEFGFAEEDLDVVHRFAPDTSQEIVLRDDKLKMTHVTPRKTWYQEFLTGKGTWVDEEYLFDKPQYVAKTTATVKGDTITFKRKLPKSDREIVEVLECDDAGCKGLLTVGKKSANIYWKRV